MSTLEPVVLAASTDSCSSHGKECKATYDWEKIIRKCIECPVCLEERTAPSYHWYQCHNGHLFCNVCLPRLRECPQCRVKLPKPPIRCLALDEVSSIIEIQCRYAYKGCKTSMPAGKIVHHETQECPYRPWKCPLSRMHAIMCNWSGDKEEMVAHVQSSHAGRAWGNVFTKTPEELASVGCAMALDDSYSERAHHIWPLIKTEFNQEILFVGRSVYQGSLCVFVTSATDTVKFRYSATIAINGRIFSYSGYVYRLRRPQPDEESYGDCLCVDVKLLKALSSNSKEKTPIVCKILLSEVNNHSKYE